MSRKVENTESNPKPNSKKKNKGGLEIEGYRIEGLSIGGQETCVIFPGLKIAFDIGRCPQRAVAQDFLFISHGHMDHIGGLPMYIATRGLFSMKPPTIFVPKSIEEHVKKLIDVHREMDQSQLNYTLVALGVGNVMCPNLILRRVLRTVTWTVTSIFSLNRECWNDGPSDCEEFILRKDLKVKAFKTYHVIPSQGYVIYSVKQKLKPEYVGRPGNELRDLRLSGVEITNTTTSPEIAFTGDTMADFIVDQANADVLRAKILVMECTFLENSITVEHAREYGHTHLAEVVKYAEMFQNKAILLIHFSARYQVEEIEEAVSKLPATFVNRVFALTEGI